VIVWQAIQEKANLVAERDLATEFSVPLIHETALQEENFQANN
jgi:hypothetical protein